MLVGMEALRLEKAVLIEVREAEVWCKERRWKSCWLAMAVEANDLVGHQEEELKE